MSMSETAVKHCDCKHEAQDRIYGKELRLHNAMAGEKGKWRCTVCGREKG